MGGSEDQCESQRSGSTRLDCDGRQGADVEGVLGVC